MEPRRVTTEQNMASQRDAFTRESKSTHRREVITPQTPVWRAFYTRPRHEIRAAARLTEAGIDVYCPTIKTKVRWSDRWKKVTKPLFTSYIFARVDEKLRNTVLEDPGVSRCVFYLGKPAEIRDDEIEAIRTLLDRAESVEVQHFQPGQRLRITDGPLAQTTGSLIQISGNKARLRIAALGTEIIATLPVQALAETHEPAE
jgi:transcription antitermination factor NusG